MRSSTCIAAVAAALSLGFTPAMALATIPTASGTAVGSSGGGPFIQSCPSGTVLTGIAGMIGSPADQPSGRNYDYIVYRVTGICEGAKQLGTQHGAKAPGLQPPMGKFTMGEDFELRCDRGAWVVGSIFEAFNARTDKYLANRLQLICSDGKVKVTPRESAQSIAQSDRFYCPAGNAAAGLQGTASDWVYSLALTCAKAIVPERPVALAKRPGPSAVTMTTNDAGAATGAASKPAGEVTGPSTTQAASEAAPAASAPHDPARRPSTGESAALQAEPPATAAIPNEWSAIRYVTSGLSLVAFLAALAASAYRARLAHQERLILLVPEKERPELVAAILDKHLRAKIDWKMLTKVQQTDLAEKTLHAEQRRYLIAAVVVCFIGVLLALVALYGHQQQPGQAQERHALWSPLGKRPAIPSRQGSDCSVQIAAACASAHSVCSLSPTAGHISARFLELSQDADELLRT